MTIRELKQLISELPDNLLVGVVYSLNDWPGDAWGDLRGPIIKTPIELTTTGSAHEDSSKPHLLFDVRWKL